MKLNSKPAGPSCEISSLLSRGGKREYFSKYSGRMKKRKLVNVSLKVCMVHDMSLNKYQQSEFLSPLYFYFALAAASINSRCSSWPKFFGAHRRTIAVRAGLATP